MFFFYSLVMVSSLEKELFIHESEQIHVTKERFKVEKPTQTKQLNVIISLSNLLVCLLHSVNCHLPSVVRFTGNKMSTNFITNIKGIS